MFYVRDAQGNILATYNLIKGSGKGGNKLFLDEQVIYGSSRIGTIKRNLMFPRKGIMMLPQKEKLPPVGGGIIIGGPGKPPIAQPPAVNRYTGICGGRRYEITSLQNVQVVISDKKVAVDTNADAKTDFYKSHVVSATDFYPGGFEIKNRTHQSSSYKWGYNGKYRDNEAIAGGGPLYDYGFRIYHLGLSRFLSVDPLFKGYPFYTPYQFSGNNQILNVDLDGLEELPNEELNKSKREGIPVIEIDRPLEILEDKNKSPEQKNKELKELDPQPLPLDPPDELPLKHTPNPPVIDLDFDPNKLPDSPQPPIPDLEKQPPIPDIEKTEPMDVPKANPNDLPKKTEPPDKGKEKIK